MGAAPHGVSPGDYLEHERLATDRHEYLDGQVVAKSGGSGNQARISSNVIRSLGTSLKGRP